ncbi:MAG TPA: PGPGW domain-containing protein [Kofleriaceae bacterium]|nr:PGPGW domain-containing protein [Kofleriaceae bacterium]
MASGFAQLKHEWQAFKDDEPGERFEDHHDRMKHASKGFNIGATALGVFLLLAGIVLCVIPGPGTPLIVFGLALLAARWQRAAKVLDRGELKVRKGGRRLKRWWHALSKPAKAGVIIGLVILAAGASMFVWRFVVSAYLLG